MPLSASSITKLNRVYPPLAALIHQLSDFTDTLDRMLIVTAGFRTMDDQAVLYAKGRDSNGRVVDARAIITNAAPGYSWHEYSLAVDVAIENPITKSLDWDAHGPTWQAVIAHGILLGMVSGSCFHGLLDNPHFQLTGHLPEVPNVLTRSLYATGGIPAIIQAAFPLLST